MPINKWVIHTASGEFKFGGFYEPTPPDADHSVVTLTGAYAETMPDQGTQKWNGSAVVAKTPTEINAYDTALLTEQVVQEVRVKKDAVATIAWAIRFSNPAAWNAKTIAQKRQAVLDELENWKPIREFVQKQAVGE